jgi:subtilisin family serine protease
MNQQTFWKTIIGLALGILATGMSDLSQPAWAQAPAGPGEAGDGARVVVLLRQPRTGPELRAQSKSLAQTQAGILAELPAFDLIHRFETLPGLVGEVSAEGMTALLQRPDVAAVALDLPVEAALTESTVLIGADRVWQEYGLTGAGFTVALLDTGLDSGHPDLAGRVVAEHCFNRDGSCPPDDTLEGDSAQDENGHGTHVAGIIAGAGGEAPGGLAPQVDLVAVRVLSASGSGFTSDVLAGLDWVISNQDRLQVDIINLSLGGGRYSGDCDQTDANTRLYAQAVQAARETGITLFAASGNSGLADQMMLPACLSGVISVGSTYDADVGPFSLGDCTDSQTGPDQVTCASNSSSTLDLLAPGAVINATALGGGQGTKSGTSMSTAHASGVAALMLEANPTLTPAEIETVLKETGRPLTDPRTGRVTPRLDALAAVTQISPTQPLTISGTILLQGRTDQSNTALYLTEADCPIPFQIVDPLASGLLSTETGTDGSFTFSVPEGQIFRCLQAVQPGYLAGQLEQPQGDLGSTALPAGDVNGDQRIDIFDLALMGSRFDSNDSQADVNGDGTVDILDLVLAAANYRLIGPQPIEPGFE